MPLTLLESDYHTLSLSFNPSIIFFTCLWLALRWKKRVFLSPTLSHNDLKRCLQYTSSWCNRVLMSLFNSVMQCKFCPCPCSTKCSNSCCFSLSLCLVLPKAIRLQANKSAQHCLIFSNRRFMWLPEDRDRVHEFQITCSHSG